MSVRSIFARGPRGPRVRAALPVALLAALLALACRDEPGAGAVADTVLRERAVAAFVADRSRPERALAELEPLLARPRPQSADLVLAASLALQANDLERCRRLVEQAGRDGSAGPGLDYLRARLAHLAGELDEELRHLEAALAAAPDDPPTKLCLAGALCELGDDELARAERLLDEVLALGPENGLPWYVGAAYQRMLLAGRRGDDPTRDTYRALFESLEQRGLKAPSGPAMNEGVLARIVPPRPAGTSVPVPKAPSFEAGPPLAPALAGATELLLEDLDGDRRPDLVAAGPNGLVVTAWEGDTLRTHVLVAPGAPGGPVERSAGPGVRLVRALDLHNDGDTLDLAFAVGPALALLEQNAPGVWTPTPLELPTLPAAPTGLEPVDLDHDGDLDLVVVGPFGVRLLRNDGAARLLDASGDEYPRGGFTDVTREALPPAALERPFAWCVVEDFDADQDVDLLLGGADALVLASNLRGGRFEDATARVFDDARLSALPVAADVDGDARVDLVEPGAPARLWLQDEDGALRPRATPFAVPAGVRIEALDLDLDGALDLVWPGREDAAEGVLAFGLSAATRFRVGAGQAGGALAFADLDFRPDTRAALEGVQLVPEGARIWRATSPLGNATRFKFAGRKDNRQAVGAVVEVRAGPLYRRLYARGQALVIGYGDHAALDVVRITWPNGVVQSLLDVAPGDRFSPATAVRDFGFDTSGVTTESVVQDEGLIGSCPFLYAWNGTTYAFVTDVLGTTPLGLSFAPGELVPPDHDEHVLVRGDQLVPRDGRLELQLTEELREVTYLDHARLAALDHPAGTEVYPDERFTFPPFPEPHVHSVRHPLAPARATDADGRDWTAALAALDDVHAVPFTRLPPQYQGLTPPYHLELEFDAERVRGATKLRLVCTGWLQWGDASVNLAAARTPGVAFAPPRLQVPGPDGTWLDAGPPVGFPAGKSKTMVIDVSAILSAEDPRLRIASTLELYWDRIALATDGDDAPLVVRSLPALEARLAWRGFSAPLAVSSSSAARAANPLPERFDWERLEPRARWNQHPGLYTRYGDCLPLVGAVDERFVLLGAGDALTLVFDASALPPVAEGFARDWMLYLDGWAKDRDPNTLEALAVEPLPFHGMSGYPYGPDERFPDDELHRAWRREWNTRPARRSIEPLVPRRAAGGASPSGTDARR